MGEPGETYPGCWTVWTIGGTAVWTSGAATGVPGWTRFGTVVWVTTLETETRGAGWATAIGGLTGVTTLVGNPEIIGVAMARAGQLWNNQLLVLHVPKQSQADWLPGRHWLVIEHHPILISLEELYKYRSGLSSNRVGKSIRHCNGCKNCWL